MLLSIRWLQECVDITVPVEELAHRLTMCGIEVEAVTEIGQQWDHIAVAEVQESRQHPDADRLSLNTVSTGAQTLQIVCGAPNVRAGLKVALALPGAVLPGGFTIKRSKIRGCISEGMLCSASELGLGDDKDGILELDTALVPGTPLADALDLRDTVLDLGITPNRPDCLSVIGIAREVSALFDLPVRLPSFRLPHSGPAVENMIAVDIESPDACPRYCAGYAYDITVAPSPLWMRRRLENCGIRSINTIVDITNYVLLEWGQPLHAFDYDRLGNARIVVRRAGGSELFTTLDGITHDLPQGALMICDAHKPRALAGIMGGLDCGITESTTAVLLESAYFNPACIAATGRSLGIKTEASQRFEKGVDINGVVPALNRAAALIAELGAGKIAAGTVDCYPAPLPERPTITVCVEEINLTLGLKLSADAVTRCLQGLHIPASPAGTGRITVTPPSHRYDLSAQIDIAEEIARMTGYDAIPVTYPSAGLSATVSDVRNEAAGLARRLLTAAGFSEVINFSFQSPELLSSLRFAPDDRRSNPVRLLNPLSASQSVMRTTILGSLLLNLQHNLHAARCAALSIFELSNVFMQEPDGSAIHEKHMLAGLAYGVRHTDCWSLPEHPLDIFDIKGCVAMLLQRFNIHGSTFETGCDEPYLHPQAAMRIAAGDSVCGLCGTLHPDIAESFGAVGPVHVFELDFDLLCSYYSTTKNYMPFSRFPAVQRDLALVVDDSITAADISAAIAEFGSTLLRTWNIFDVYQGDRIASGKKSVAYRLIFQSDDKTLTDNEVNTIHDSLLEHLRRQFGAELR